MKWYRRLARRVGYDVVPLRRAATLEAQLAYVLTRLQVATVFDVGANTGQYGELLREIGFAGRIISFEPVAAHAAALESLAARDGRWEVHRVALGAAAGEAEIHVTASGAMSSLHRPSPFAGERMPEHARILRTERVPVTTLDTILQETGNLWSTGPVLLKLDTQGHDLEVLRGATGSLARVAAVQVELSLRPLYEGVPDYRVTLDALAAVGFTPSGFFPVVRAADDLALVEMDGILVRARGTVGPPG